MTLAFVFAYFLMIIIFAASAAGPVALTAAIVGGAMGVAALYWLTRPGGGDQLSA